MAGQSKYHLSEKELDELRKNVVIESPTRYVFNSLTQKDCAHVVDLIENNSHGECSCQHFQYRVLPMIKQGIIKQDSEKARCKHIRIARQLFYETAIDAYKRVIEQK